jgi:NhaP-type Na+/H+ or K+/H+ antiporter
LAALALTVLVLIGYAILSRRFSTTSLSGPIVFVTLGLVMSDQVLGIFTVELDEEIIQILLKATLVVLLFTEASELRIGTLRAERSIPTRLLLIAMPLVIGIGFAVAAVTFTNLGVWEAALIAAILAPTDAALGQAVVSNERVPQDVRHGLVVESGLNDGLAFPFVLAFGGAAQVAEGAEELPDFVTLLFEQVGFGLLLGVAVGWLGGKAIVHASNRGWVTKGWLNVVFLGFAAVSFAVAEMVHGNGFIAAWVAGLVLGHVIQSVDVDVQSFSLDLTKILVMLSFVVFGALGLAPALSDLSWQVVLYALLSLVLVRPIAVAISMFRSGKRAPTVAYIGWFGPRGIASIILALIVIKKFALVDEGLIILIMTVTVAASVYLHGMTAWPGSNAYANWYQGERDEDAVEPTDPES